MKKITMTLSVMGCVTLAGVSYFLQNSSNHMSGGFPDEAVVVDDGVETPASTNVSADKVTLSEASPDGTETIIKPVTYDEYQSVYGPLPGSLEGAPLPTGLSVDSDGQLIPTLALQRLYDFFLTTVGEEPLERVVERIQEYLDVQLDEPALSQAKEVLDNYLNLKSAIIEMEAEWSEEVVAGGERPHFTEIVARKRELRLLHLGEQVYDAFYVRDDQLDDYMLKKLAVLQDESLSEQEQSDALKALESLLPEEVQQKKDFERQYDTLQQDIDQARTLGASEDEIYQMRLEVLGAEKANRYQRADLAQRNWDDRVSTYRGERNQILNSGLSDEDKESQIQQLRERHFEGRELMRIPVIDRMKDQEEILN